MDKRVRRTIRDIHETTIRLCLDTPLKDLTFSRIALEADYSRGTLYQHYRNVEDLIQAIEQEKTEGLIHAFREPYLNKQEEEHPTYSPREIRIFSYILEEKAFFTLVTKSADFHGFRDHLVERLIDMFISDMDVLIEELNGLRPERYAEFQAYGLYGLLNEWIQRNFQESPEEMSVQLIRMFFCDDLHMKHRGKGFHKRD